MSDATRKDDALKCAKYIFHLMKECRTKARLYAYTVHARGGAEGAEDIYNSEVEEAVKLIKEDIPGYYLKRRTVSGI